MLSYDYMYIFGFLSLPYVFVAYLPLLKLFRRLIVYDGSSGC